MLDFLHFQMSGEPQECDSDDYFVFADGVTVSIIEGELRGTAKGTHTCRNTLQKQAASWRIKSLWNECCPIFLINSQFHEDGFGVEPDDYLVGIVAPDGTFIEPLHVD